MSQNPKFRAWDTVTKQYIFTGFHVIGEVTCFGLMEEWLQEHMDERPAETLIDAWNDIVLEQFSGLKDYDNNDIYDGDFVHIEDNIMGPMRQLVRFPFTGLYLAKGAGRIRGICGNIHNE